MDADTTPQGARRIPELDLTEPPAGSDRRALMMRGALAVAIAAMTGRPAREGGLAVSLVPC